MISAAVLLVSLSGAVIVARSVPLVVLGRRRAAALVVGGDRGGNRWWSHRWSGARRAFAEVRRRALGSANLAWRRREQSAHLALLDRLGRALRVGVGLHQALREATRSPAVRPTGLNQVVASVDRGTPLHEALETWRSASRAPEAALVAAVVGLGIASGGDLARAVDRAAATVRERMAVEREARALATQATTSAVVVAVAPLAFTVLAAVGDPRVGAFLLTQPAGWACIVAGLALEAAGGLWMLRLVRRAR